MTTTGGKPDPELGVTIFRELYMHPLKLRARHGNKHPSTRSRVEGTLMVSSEQGWRLWFWLFLRVDIIEIKAPPFVSATWEDPFPGTMVIFPFNDSGLSAGEQEKPENQGQNNKQLIPIRLNLGVPA